MNYSRFKRPRFVTKNPYLRLLSSKTWLLYNSFLVTRRRNKWLSKPTTTNSSKTPSTMKRLKRKERRQKKQLSCKRKPSKCWRLRRSKEVYWVLHRPLISSFSGWATCSSPCRSTVLSHNFHSIQLPLWTSCPKSTSTCISHPNNSHLFRN